MDEMTRIEQTIHSERRDLDRNLTELDQKVRSMADWRTHYRNNPWAAVGVAAGAGVVLGILTAGSAESAESSESPRVSRERGDRSGRGSRAMSTLAHIDPRGRASSRLGETWDGILDALAGVASAAAIRFVAKHVPGFEEEHTSSQTIRRGDFVPAAPPLRAHS